MMRKDADDYGPNSLTYEVPFIRTTDLRKTSERYNGARPSGVGLLQSHYEELCEDVPDRKNSITLTPNSLI